MAGSIVDCIPFIDFQVGLETLVVECMENIHRVEDSEMRGMMSMHPTMMVLMHSRIIFLISFPNQL